MAALLTGFICALILAAFVIAWIAFCMFCRERHKSESHQYNISDLKHQNRVLETQKEEKDTNKTLAAGIFILPSRRPHKEKGDEYTKRPDYPESPVPILQPGMEDYVKIFNENAVIDSCEVHNRNVVFEIDSNSQYHSDV